MFPIIPPPPVSIPVEIISLSEKNNIKVIDFSDNEIQNNPDCCNQNIDKTVEEYNENIPSVQTESSEEVNYSSPNVEQSPVSIPIQTESSEEANYSSPEVEETPVSIPIQVEYPPLETEENEVFEPSASQLGQPISVGEDKVGQINPNVENSTNSLNIEKKNKKYKITRLLTQSRQGSQREFRFKNELFNNTQLSQNANPDSVTIPLEESVNVVEIVADQQEYFDKEQIIKAKGKVVIRFSNGVLSADQVKINLPDRIAVAEGNVILKRGDQILRGNRFEYYFVQDQGVIFNANGEIYQPNLGRDFAQQTANNPISKQPLSWQIESSQPLQRVTTAEGYQFAVGSIRDLNLVGQSGIGGNTASRGQVNRLRFQAARVDFNSEGWHATDIRFTNDPFSPPELEIRADSADLTNIEPFVDELTTSRSRLVFDQNLSVPLFQDRSIFDRRKRNPGLLSIGFDGEDRGGLYIQRAFDIYTDKKIEFTLAPQFLLQRAFWPDSYNDTYAINPDDNGGLLNPSSYGLIASLNVNFNPRTDLTGILNFTGLDLDNINNRLRATLQVNQKLGELNSPYSLSFQYSFRERLFNGSLGFQTVQQSIGSLIRSPYIPLGNSGLGLVYQGSIQNITAKSDRQELINPNQNNNLANLTRYQGAALISGGFVLWNEEALPATPDAGLKYTATPVAPYLKLNTGITGVTSYYSNGDNQPSLTGTIGLEGQIGHFSEDFLDYTGFNISYSQGLRGDQSPFYFDRYYDTQVLSLGLTQQLYGPVRAGVQTFFNVATSEEISTDYFLEYSRRTYNIILRYNPVLELGSINLRINDFNWEGNPLPFEGIGIKPVIGGVTDN